LAALNFDVDELFVVLDLLEPQPVKTSANAVALAIARATIGRLLMYLTHPFLFRGFRVFASAAAGAALDLC
jgi:hypothetical protein